MRKLVNGRVVDISNIELFELAEEGLALQSMAVSNTSEGIDGNINAAAAKKYIKQYDAFYKAMPYPLYAIERPIKYAALGTFIKTFSKEDVKLWVDNGLNINLDKHTGMMLKIVNNTWSISYSKEIGDDNTDIDLYSDSIGYKEYKWLLSKIIKKETTANFYLEFMTDFVRACSSQPMVLKWELENILTFSPVPKKLELKQDKVIDIPYQREYSLDIFCNGTVDTDEKMQSWSLSGSSNKVGGFKYKSLRTYDFEPYVKSLSESNIPSEKLEKSGIIGLRNLFMELCGIKSANDMTVFPSFYGLIYDTNLVFTIDGRLFVSKSNRLTSSKEIANNVELYSFEKNKVYFVKSKKINDRLSKDTLYSYNIPDGSVHMCKIIFTY